jgi:membrane-associated phospholipid phosphatase
VPKGAGIYHLDAFHHLHAGTDPGFGLADMSGLVTFPSFHTVLGLLLAQAVAETRLAWLGVAASAAVIVSTIPIGGHYVIDILAGTLIWLIAAVIARRISSPSGS